MLQRLKVMYIHVPLMTSPIPILNLNGFPRSLEESNFFPFVRVPERDYYVYYL